MGLGGVVGQHAYRLLQWSTVFSVRCCCDTGLLHQEHVHSASVRTQASSEGLTQSTAVHALPWELVHWAFRCTPLQQHLPHGDRVQRLHVCQHVANTQGTTQPDQHRCCEYAFTLSSCMCVSQLLSVKAVVA